MLLAGCTAYALIIVRRILKDLVERTARFCIENSRFAGRGADPGESAVTKNYVLRVQSELLRNQKSESARSRSGLLAPFGGTPNKKAPSDRSLPSNCRDEALT